MSCSATTPRGHCRRLRDSLRRAKILLTKGGALLTIVCHSRKFIFIRTRKTAGSSIAIWLSDFLDPKTDLMAPPREMAQLRPDHRFASSLSGWGERLRRLQLRRPRLSQHPTAEQLRRFVGSEVWCEYTKFAVERNPWDRLLSLWRWRMQRNNLHLSLDEYLDAIESGDKAIARRAGAQRASNWPSYTINDELAVDHIVFYESLNDDLARVCGGLGLPWDGALPHAKVGFRGPDDHAGLLTAQQIERIGRIFHREIALFGYRAPVPVSAPASDPARGSEVPALHERQAAATD
jgi:hypothetical protein